MLRGLTDNKLQRVQIVPHGERLEAGAIYLNIADDDGQPFTARGDETVGPYEFIVPKRGADYVLWNRLTGVDDPARLDLPDEGATNG